VESGEIREEPKTTDAKTRGWVENRSSRRVWAAVSDQPGVFFAFPVEPGRSTDPAKNDVDDVRPADPGILLMPTMPVMAPRANAWFKVRGGHVRLTDQKARIGLEELDSWTAAASRPKERRNFWTDLDIQNMYNRQPTCFGPHAGLSNTKPIPGFQPGTTPGVPPPGATRAPATPKDAEHHTVVRGDSLSSIASHAYRSKREPMLLWPVIYDANKAIIGGNPNVISPGQKLRIPNIGGLSEVELDQVRRRGRNWR
jgi:LysM repeat protein